MEKGLNATCIVTGKKDNLRMHAHRDKDGNMVGWVFLHESVSELEMDLELKFSAKGSTVEVPQNGMIEV